jgi:hypothetical protein
MNPRRTDHRWRTIGLGLSAMVVVAACGSGLAPVATPEGLLASQAATVAPPTPTPTPAPTPDPTPLPMDVTSEAFTDTAAQNKTASVTVRTEAQAKCTIEVLYDSGPSQAAGLDPKSATSAGKVIWSWRVGSNTAPGVYPVTIVCTLDDHEGTLELDFTVTR